MSMQRTAHLAKGTLSRSIFHHVVSARQRWVQVNRFRGGHTCRWLRPFANTFCAQQLHETTTQHVEHGQNAGKAISSPLAKVTRLPTYCPGCGAPSQTVSTADAGFYTVNRKGLSDFFKSTKPSVHALEAEYLDKPENAPNCDRCHNLLNHSVGEPIFHPSIQSIHDIILESPHEHNHIYHVLDAADLPMSLIPTLQKDLELPRLRSQNRRSKHIPYARGRVAEVSFIITRADLLAPTKEQVDTLLPYLREVLRDALGQAGRQNVRLGSLRCVSAHRGWWTKRVKEDVWERGGAAWMVGKVNVGKSSLFEATFPKGRVALLRKAKEDSMRISDKYNELHFENRTPMEVEDEPARALAHAKDGQHDPDALDALDETEETLLPPARKESDYPSMPIASALPGTTASPIRIPFGQGRGELVDLPGVARDTLDNYIKPQHRRTLVMQSRIKADKFVIKPGQSLLLAGGLIRISARDPDTVILAHPFVPLPAHITSTAKAEALASGERPINDLPGADMPLPHACAAVRRALTVPLKWDVTRARAGPLTDATVGALKPSQLPFAVWSADLLIEGVGWVELVAQTRRRPETRVKQTARDRRDEKRRESQRLAEEAARNPFPEAMSDAERLAEASRKADRERDDELAGMPAVDVFSPEGKFVSYRRPMGAYVLGGRGSGKQGGATPGRPRKSVSGARRSAAARGKKAAAA